MIPVYCRDPSAKHVLQDTIDTLPARLFEDWRTFLHMSEIAPYAIVCLPQLDTPEAEDLRRLAREGHERHWIMVTRAEVRNLRGLRGLTFDELIYTSEIRELSKVVEDRGSRSMAAVIERHCKRLCQDRTVMNALVLALTAIPAITTCKELARATLKDRRTLWEHWRHERHKEVDLAELLKEIIALRVAERAHAGRTPKQIASDLQISLSGVRKALKRCGCTSRHGIRAGQVANLCSSILSKLQ